MTVSTKLLVFSNWFFSFFTQLLAVCTQLLSVSTKCLSVSVKVLVITSTAICCKPFLLFYILSCWQFLLRFEAVEIIHSAVVLAVLTVSSQILYDVFLSYSVFISFHLDE